MRLRSAFVEVVAAVFIKFTCFCISSNFRRRILVAYSQKMHVLLLNSCANFLHFTYHMREFHTVDVLLRKPNVRKLVFSHHPYFYSRRTIFFSVELLGPMSLTRSPLLDCFINQGSIFVLKVNCICTPFSRLLCQAILTNCGHDHF
jgi:hypothetical protein